MGSPVAPSMCYYSHSKHFLFNMKSLIFVGSTKMALTVAPPSQSKNYCKYHCVSKTLTNGGTYYLHDRSILWISFLFKLGSCAIQETLELIELTFWLVGFVL